MTRLSTGPVAAAACTLLFPALAAAQNWTCEQLMVPMRDGTRLATDVYLPRGQGPGPFPVVLERTPYNKGACSRSSAEYFAARGYIAMAQDERGRYESEGEYYWLMDEGWGERQDGYDTIEWAARHPMSSGKVGTHGLSFTCANQLLTAPTQPPHLEAMFCSQYASNSYRDIFWQGGALHMVLPTWLLTQREMVKPLRMNVPGHRGYLGSGDAWTAWYDEHREVGDSFTESMFSDMYNDLVGNPYYNDYWRRLAVDEQYDKFDVPIYHLGGWYDRHIHGTVQHFKRVNEVGGPRGRGQQKLIVGPWIHGWPPTGDRVGDMNFPGSSIDHLALRLRWFDHHLKGHDNGIMDEAPVLIYVMGDNVWREENEFPLARQQEEDWYLRAGPAGSIDSLNDGLLSRDAPPDAEAPDSYEYDPRKPAPTIGGDLFVEPRGAQDHRPADRVGLTYTSEPLDAPLEVTGIVRVEFFAASSAVDTDWVVTMNAVHESGYSQLLRQMIQRARYREGDEAPVLLTPGEIVPYTVELYPMSNVFLPGQRIRLTVTSSSFPKWYPNGNTGREMMEDRPGVVATNTIYHDAEHPSKVVLPVIPR